MTTGDRPRFDIDALREIAGEKVFAREEAYHREGQVAILSIERKRVLAQVAGTEDYRTVLTGRGAKIGGECSCPAFEDWGFCKHMVAAALAANAAGTDAEADGAGALARIRDHLKAKGIDALVAMILDIAERDPALFRRLDAAAAAIDADDRTLEARLRKLIDAATRSGGYIDYREAAGWAQGVDSALDAVADLATGKRAGVAMKLAERALDRIARAAEEIDDSDGHCGGLLERARDIHCTAAGAARPDPVALARALFAREMAVEYGTFDDAATRYADALGEAGLAEYRRLAAAEWAKLPPRAGRAPAAHESDGNYDALKRILDAFAEHDGDVAARIALRTKDLSAPWHYLQLAEFCQAQGRDDDAVRWATEGLWVFEDERPNERLLFFAVDLLCKAGRGSEAEAQIWRCFEKAPSLELYARLRRLAGKGVHPHAVNVLQARLAGETRTRWHSPADLLIRVQMHEESFDAAWATVRAHGASAGVKEALARASEATHPREALAVYAERIDQLAEGGGNPAYAEAAALIARMAALHSAAEQSAYVATLRARFGGKRNFMKLLE